MRIKQSSTVRRYDSDPDYCSPEFGRQLRDSSLQRIGRSKMREFWNCKLPHAAKDTICKLFRHVAGAIVFCGSTTMIRSLSAAVHFCVKSNNALRRISSLRFIETVGLRKRTFFCDCSGSTVPIVAIAMTALIGFASLGTEVGVWYGVRRDMQGATDAAAYSAALAKNRPPGTSTIVDAQARSVTAQQGYKDGSNGVSGIAPCSVELYEAVVAVNDVKRPSQFGQERDCWSPFRSERPARPAGQEVACRL